MWLCRCVCGSVSKVYAVALIKGVSRSCGCLAKEALIGRSLKHGATSGYVRTKEYRAWLHAKGRCNTPTDHKYKSYGRRGIQMSPEWEHSFTTFLADMGPCPDKHSLDRINTNKGYSKENCRWATAKEQANNTRRNIVIDFNGQLITLKQLSELFRINYKRLHRAFRYEGEDPIKAAQRLSQHA